MMLASQMANVLCVSRLPYVQYVYQTEKGKRRHAKCLLSGACTCTDRSMDRQTRAIDVCTVKKRHENRSSFCSLNDRVGQMESSIDIFFLVERQVSANRTGFNFIDERISFRQSFFRVLLKKKDTGYDIVFFLSLSIHSCQRLQIGMLLQVI